jgi:hypothetical protein
MAMTNDRLGRHGVVLGGATLRDAFPPSTYVPLGYKSHSPHPAETRSLTAAAHCLPPDHS